MLVGEACPFLFMENSSEVLGSKGLIRRHEFVRIIIQCLYSLGYRNLPLFLVFKQCVMEYLNRGEDNLALGSIEGDIVDDLRKKLLTDLEQLFHPPISVPETRLEHLVETTVTSWVDSCMYHSSSNPISLYEDHHCGRDQIPTTTTQILTGHKNEVWFVQFSNNGEYLASSSNDCTAIIWKVLEDGKLTLKHTLHGHKHAVSFVAWSPDDTKLLTCGNTEVLKLWDVETVLIRKRVSAYGIVMEMRSKTWRGLRMPKVVDLAVTPDGEYLISIFLDKEIRILRMGTNAERVISEEHPNHIPISSGDSEFFIVNLNSQEIHMWDVAGKWDKPLRFMGHKQHKYVIRSCFGGVNNTFIASGSENSQEYVLMFTSYLDGSRGSMCFGSPLDSDRNQASSSVQSAPCTLLVDHIVHTRFQTLLSCLMHLMGAVKEKILVDKVMTHSKFSSQTQMQQNNMILQCLPWIHYPEMPSSSQTGTEYPANTTFSNGRELAISNLTMDGMETDETKPAEGSQQGNSTNSDSVNGMLHGLSRQTANRGVFPELGQFHQFFSSRDPSGWELPFLQGWLMGQSQVGVPSMLPHMGVGRDILAQQIGSSAMAPNFSTSNVDVVMPSSACLQHQHNLDLL
ncbi:WD40/YVTN repeat-like-containing domain superfamily [Sesbania bispinosa]|nr:WD40/YVTN repeat-like-containing domain superfamily [Sesbania bispinosa]